MTYLIIFLAGGLATYFAMRNREVVHVVHKGETKKEEKPPHISKEMICKERLRGAKRSWWEEKYEII